MTYDAILLISFGGPESPEDVMPFLENVLRGRDVPRARMLEVAEHYYKFGGKSPINNQNRRLLASLAAELAEYGPHLPIYWGNRNWHPLLIDTLARMKADGIQHALGFVTSAFSSYSNCRQYREDIARAQAEIGEGAPEVDKIRVFFNHPGFVEATADRVRVAMEQFPEERRAAAHLVFTAHSIPLGMAQLCDYEKQLRETARLVGDVVGHHPWHLVYQSRSGPPSQPWLGPDILAALRQLKAQNGSNDVVIAPIGFVSDHMEVIFDLDTQARELCEELGMTMARAETVGTHPRFIRMIRELVAERMDASLPRAVLGTLGARPDVCAPDCCLPPSRRPS
jgi:ferrochelatase